MTKTRETFTTPIGRLVMGDCFEPQTKDQAGNPRTFKSGDKIGQPNPQYFIGVAFPKTLPNPQTGQMEPNHEFNAFYALLDRVARQEWPALFPNPNGPCVNQGFAFKVRDGDGFDRSGKSNAEKEGWAGNWVVSFASSYAPKVVRPAGNNVWEAITDGSLLKRGYFVRVAGSATGNNSPQTPGIYLNLDMVEFAGYGTEIVSGPDAATVFGSQPSAPIPGMMAQPPVGAGLPNPATGTSPLPGQPQMQPTLPGQPSGVPSLPLAQPAALAAPPPGPAMTPPPASAATAMISPPSPVQPYTGYMGVPGATPGAPNAPLAGAPGVSPSGLPGPAGAPSVPPVTPSPSRTMTAAAGGNTYESFIAAGWTDDLLIQNGFMTA